MSEHPSAKWAVLATFAWGTCLNGFSFMNFATTASLTKDLFDCDESAVNWLYSAGLVGCLSIYVPVVAWLPKYNWQVTAFGYLCLAGSGILRVLSVLTSSYLIALASSVLLGWQAAVLITSFVPLSERWFPATRVALATQICMQSNYLGWALGTIVTPYVAVSRCALIHDLSFNRCQTHARASIGETSCSC
jgi:hypothetical protein